LDLSIFIPIFIPFKRYNEGIVEIKEAYNTTYYVDMAKLINKIPLIVFRLLCFLLAIYMSITQIRKYFGNKDKASVTFRQFNHAPRDRYPTYTICFENQNYQRSFYNQSYLKNGFGINASDYLNHISGRINNETHNFINLSNINFEMAAKHPENIIREVFVGYNTGKQELVNSELAKHLKVNKRLSWVNPLEIKFLNAKLNQSGGNNYSDKFPLYKTYQDYDRVCLSRKNDYRHAFSRSFERLAIWSRRRSYFDKIRIYIHHPSQGMRTFFQRLGTKAVIARELRYRNFNIMKFFFTNECTSKTP
jgi:hypothetical protein